MHEPVILDIDLTNVAADDGASHAVACWEISGDGRYLKYRATSTAECCCQACMLVLALVDVLEDLDLAQADTYVRFIRGAAA